MNIFYLDDDVQRCAEAHCDKHVVKMILESAQILCAVLHKTGQESPYRLTHKHHPCVLWAGESLDNWLWLRDLAHALNEEYKLRYNKQVNHKSYDVILSLALPNIPSIGITTRPQTMPDEFKSPGDAVTAYRNYYTTGKKHLLVWTNRATPAWCL